MSEQPDFKIGRFDVVQPLGRGSQGAVYLARDPTLDRLVAIKLLNEADEDLAPKAANGAPLEGVIASKLNHPNIVPVFDAGEADDGQYLVFEYVEGRTLSRILKRDGPWSVAGIVPVCKAILDGMANAHEAGILHLDLSPRNVMLSATGSPRIMDFGLSQFADMTRVSSDFATGTLRYMSPEHFLGRPLGPWTDVFALGSTFFELVTGQHAMTGTKLEEVRAKIIRVDVDFEAIVRLEHGEAFARFLAGAMQPNPQGRYADCSAMREAFLLFLEEIGVEEPGTDGSSRHSTIDFLLRRMQRRKEFPTISSTLADINRLTADDADTSADKLANVILRDMALTSKLLKLVNSAFYGVRAAEITSISQAVVFLGLEQVRMTANSLTLFGALKSDSQLLKDAMIRSFMSGLIARHLVQREKLRGIEEAFIAGLCRNLGENLVIYYFRDEFDDIEELRQTQALDKAAASRAILGVSYSDLGAAVTHIWGLPRLITDVIRGLPPGPVRTASSDERRLRNLCVFASELCDIFHGASPASSTRQLEKLLEKFAPGVSVDADYAVKLINAGFDKLTAYAPVFEVDTAKSAFCGSVRSWLEDRLPTDDAERRSA